MEWRAVGGPPYTGVFRGAEHCVIRMSLTTEPDPRVKKTSPGFGLKCLRDGVDSGNLVAMFSVSGQESWNFFLKNFSNHVSKPPFSSLPLALKFATATKQIQQVGLSNMAL